MPFLKVKDRTVKNIVTMDPEQSIRMAGELMLSHSIGSVIVTNNDQPVGIITERDLIRYVFQDENYDTSLPISTIMNSPLATINLNEKLTEAAQLMIMKGYRRLGVVNAENKLIGIVSMSDLIRDMSNAKLLLTETLQETEKRGLKSLAYQISHELDHLLENVYTSPNLSQVEKETRSYYEIHSLLSRLNKIDASEYSMADRETPIYLMLASDTGVSIYSRDLSSEQTIQKSDQLMAGVMFALNNFVKEIVVDDGYIDRIKYHDHIFLIKKVGAYLLSYVFKGDSYLGIKRIETIVDEIEKDTNLMDFLDRNQHEVKKWFKTSLNDIITQVFDIS